MEPRKTDTPSIGVSNTQFPQEGTTLKEETTESEAKTEDTDVDEEEYEDEEDYEKQASFSGYFEAAQSALMRSAHKGIKSKLAVLKELKENLLYNISKFLYLYTNTKFLFQELLCDIL